MIKAIIFDFGNVICKFTPSMFLDKIANISGKNKDQLINSIYLENNLPVAFDKGSITADQFYQQIISLTGIDISQSTLIEMYKVSLYPIKSTFTLIRTLKTRYLLGLISNTNEWDFNYGIKKVSVFNLFDGVSLSFEVRHMKPSKIPYFDLLAKLNVEPHECVFIDDIKENVYAANEIGMKSILYTSSRKLILDLIAVGVNDISSR